MIRSKHGRKKNHQRLESCEENDDDHARTPRGMLSH
jgi:hypothetical protein